MKFFDLLGFSDRFDREMGTWTVKEEGDKTYKWDRQGRIQWEIDVGRKFYMNHLMKMNDNEVDLLSELKDDKFYDKTAGKILDHIMKKVEDVFKDNDEDFEEYIKLYTTDVNTKYYNEFYDDFIQSWSLQAETWFFMRKFNPQKLNLKYADVYCKKEKKKRNREVENENEREVNDLEPMNKRQKVK